MTKATLTLLSLFATSCAFAQTNPGLYFRVTKCNNIKANVFVNDVQLTSAGCADNLAWRPISFNDVLIDGKNKLRLDVKNEVAGDYYGELTLELLATSPEKGAKRFFTYEVKLQEVDRFQTNIDNLIRRQGWSIANGKPESTDDLIRQRNRRDSLDYFFDKQDRFYLVITSAKRAKYSIDINDQPIMSGSLHISVLDEMYDLKNYPFFFLNALDRSAGDAVLTYDLSPQDGKDEAYLEIAIQHYAPYAVDPSVIAVSRITCGKDDTKHGVFDITEPLRRNGFFNPK